MTMFQLFSYRGPNNYDKDRHLHLLFLKKGIPSPLDGMPRNLNQHIYKELR